jgi:hypothetical protein
VISGFYERLAERMPTEAQMATVQSLRGPLAARPLCEAIWDLIEETA